MLVHAVRHAWAAGDIDDLAVHELTQLALAGEAIARHAVTPACSQWASPSHPWCVPGKPCRSSWATSLT